MPDKRQDSPRITTTLLVLKIVVLFFFIGGLGAACGTKLIMLINGGTYLQGEKAGSVFLLVSAFLAVPGIFLLRFSGGTTGRSDMPSREANQ